MLLTSLYALATAVALAVEVMHRQLYATLAILVLSAAAYRAGEEIWHCLRTPRLTHKLAHGAVGILLIALGLYCANYSVHLVVTNLRGEVWLAVGLITGLAANSPMLARS